MSPNATNSRTPHVTDSLRVAFTQTVDFDAQDDSFMAKHLVEAGTQDIPVGTPIFVTVDDADSVAAFKNFIVDAGVPAPAPVEPAPVEEGKETPPPPPLPLAEPKQESTTPLPSASAPAPAELTAALAPASAPAKTQNTSGRFFVGLQLYF